MKIAILGPGALGCYFGGRLAVTGHDVWLLHYRPEFVERLNEQGLRIESDLTDEEAVSLSLPATTTAAEVGHADLVLVFVKAHQTEAALEQHADCIGPETYVLSLQNGLRHYEQLVDCVGERRALAGVTYQGVVVERTCVIRHTSDGLSTFGGADDGFARDVKRAFTEANLPSEHANNPVPHIWSKQLISLPIKPLAALTRLSNGELVEHDAIVELMERIIREAEMVAVARDIDIPQDDPLATVIRTCETAYSHRSSMLQDVIAGRKTEIDAVNGAIVELAQDEGIDVPINDTVTRLVRALEQSYLDTE